MHPQTSLRQRAGPCKQADGRAAVAAAAAAAGEYSPYPRARLGPNTVTDQCRRARKNVGNSGPRRCASSCVSVRARERRGGRAVCPPGAHAPPLPQCKRQQRPPGKRERGEQGSPTAPTAKRRSTPCQPWSRVHHVRPPRACSHEAARDGRDRTGQPGTAPCPLPPRPSTGASAPGAPGRHHHASRRQPATAASARSGAHSLLTGLAAAGLLAAPAASSAGAAPPAAAGTAFT